MLHSMLLNSLHLQDWGSRCKLLPQNGFWAVSVPKPCAGTNSRDDCYAIWEVFWPCFTSRPSQPQCLASRTALSPAPVACRTEFGWLRVVERRLWGTAPLCPSHPFLPSSLSGFRKDQTAQRERALCWGRADTRTHRGGREPHPERQGPGWALPS